MISIPIELVLLFTLMFSYLFCPRRELKSVLYCMQVFVLNSILDIDFWNLDVTGCFMVNFLVVGGAGKSFGILFVELVNNFDSSKGATAWVGALCQCLNLMLGKPAISLPNVQFRLPIALTTLTLIFRVLQQKCGKYRSFHQWKARLFYTWFR